jgi:ATP-dependent exoDNAse (exonuclease V) beta subunit
VTQEAASAAGDEEATLDSERARKAGAGRLGPVFGLVVHRALELMLSQSGTAVPAAVEVAAQEMELTEHLAEARADVERALDALHQAGAVADPAMSVLTEYPLTMPHGNGQLLSGFIDLLLIDADSATVIDFKTDAPIRGALDKAYPRYAAQLRLYGELLRAAQLVGHRRLRLGLLLTASGELRWL